MFITPFLLVQCCYFLIVDYMYGKRVFSSTVGNCGKFLHFFLVEAFQHLFFLDLKHMDLWIIYVYNAISF